MKEGAAKSDRVVPLAGCNRYNAERQFFINQNMLYTQSVKETQTTKNTLTVKETQTQTRRANFTKSDRVVPLADCNQYKAESHFIINPNMFFICTNNKQSN